MQRLTLTLFLMLSTLLSYAQTFGGGGTGPSFDGDVLDNPIDGGLGILLGAGVAYGAKVLRDKRNKAKDEQRMDED
jgi:hypothetical protein